MAMKVVKCILPSLKKDAKNTKSRQSLEISKSLIRILEQAVNQPR
jgi:hypothetical protein